MSDFFSENAEQVEQYLYDVKYLTPLNDDFCEIQETKAVNEGNLNAIKINDIPYDSNNPISWVFNLEIEEPSLRVQQKTPEKAVIIFIKNTVWVILIELKSTLHLFRGKQKKEVLPAIIEKIEGGIAQVLLKFPLINFIPEKAIKNIRFKAVICYNREEINKQLKTNSSYKTREEVRLFSGGKKAHVSDKNIVGSRRTVEFFWMKNETNTADFEFSLKQLDRKNELNNLS